MYNEIHFILNNTIITNKIISNNYSDEPIILQHITVVGIQNEPKNVQVNGNIHLNYTYNTAENVSIVLFLKLFKT